ncbi:predicted protein [Nematostella vectensis]|uniref:RING-type E3 ubiquitin transferase n=1 Tax=Nematostella vectensis TaxID=45351 RepID=A7SGR5_NEMVE|nr:E3 ubiquitin-protein ligase KCMF1 [Nematostella vectensis]EDO37139.1 predicted protein [Nematostella vectensis]|eukprot:XP_001629202.1 predicted protein [Nematostella vectensis]
MSRHEGVSCDSCNKGNFRGKRFKCLICYDYDLCATCFENGVTTTRHTADHPMQCILTRADFDLYYGGEAFTADQPQSFTCPYCSKIGFTEALLLEHVTSEHSDASLEVVCPVCAALPGGDPNYVTDDFAAHLTLGHRTPRDLDEPGTARHVRRMFHPGRGVSGPRPPRPRAGAMNFSSSSSSGSGATTSLSSTSSFRESMDPIAELLSQLSGVRRAAQQAQPPVQSQLQLLQQQLQLERQQVQQTRERLERLPQRRQMAASSTQSSASATTQESNSSSNSQFLLSRANEPALSESDQEELEEQRADRAMFVQDLIVSTLGSALRKQQFADRQDSIEDEFTQLTLHQGSIERGAAGGASFEYHKPDNHALESDPDPSNQDIEIINLETEDDKES